MSGEWEVAVAGGIEEVAGGWEEGGRRDGRRVVREVTGGMGGGVAGRTEDMQQERRPGWPLWGGKNPEECLSCVWTTLSSPILQEAGWCSLGYPFRKEGLTPAAESAVCSRPSALSPSPRPKKPPCPGLCQLLEQPTPKG